jgi:hypothetical protein
MAHISLERKHGTEQQEAITKIDGFLEKLLKREWPAGIKIVDSEKRWAGDEMRFSFKGKKGFLSAKIEGALRVTGDTVHLDMDVPGTVTALVGEDRIKKVIEERFARLFESAA